MSMKNILFLLIALCLLLTVQAEAQVPPTCAVALQATPPGPFPCSVTVSWQDNSNHETEFDVAKNLNGGAWNFLTKTAANVTSVVDNLLLQSTLTDNFYCYQVKAANFSAAIPPVLQLSAPSPQTASTCITTPKFVPVIIPPSSPS